MFIQPGESPKHQAKSAGDKPAAPPAAVSTIPPGSAEAQLKYENDRLKLALAQRWSSTYYIKLLKLHLLYVTVDATYFDSVVHCE